MIELVGHLFDIKPLLIQHVYCCNIYIYIYIYIYKKKNKQNVYKIYIFKNMLYNNIYIYI